MTSTPACPDIFPVGKPPVLEPFGSVPLPAAPDTEWRLVGATLYDQLAFERANVAPVDFTVQRCRWFWEACIFLKKAGDRIDERSVERALAKTGHLEDFLGGHVMNHYMLTELDHAEADGRELREMTERRRMIAAGAELTRQGFDKKYRVTDRRGLIQAFWTHADLAAAKFARPPGPVPGLIPDGLTLLAGRPKCGKSWLVLQMGCALGLGGKFLGCDLEPARVYYYALEDTPELLQERTLKLGVPSKAQIDYMLALKPLHLGGLAEVEQVAASGEYRLIIIDTIRRAMPGKDFNKDGALFDDILMQLQDLANFHKTAILVTLHTRKAAFGLDPDPIDDILGSTGLTAAADCALAMFKQQGKKGAVLKGRGRRLGEIDLALEFDELTCAWQSLGETGTARAIQSEEEILDALNDLGKAQAHTLARTLGKDYSNTHKLIAALWTRGRIQKEVIEGKTFYFLSSAESGQK